VWALAICYYEVYECSRYGEILLNCALITITHYVSPASLS